MKERLVELVSFILKIHPFETVLHTQIQTILTKLETKLCFAHTAEEDTAALQQEPGAGATAEPQSVSTQAPWCQGSAQADPGKDQGGAEAEQRAERQ